MTEDNDDDIGFIQRFKNKYRELYQRITLEYDMYMKKYEEKYGDPDEVSTTEALKNIAKGGKDDD